MAGKAKGEQAAVTGVVRRVKEWPIGRLKANERNARTHSEQQISQLAASLREFGWTVPVLIEPSGRIVAGHGRVRAARLLGMASVPCMVVEGWSEDRVRAYVIADNKLALNAGWDEALLAAELRELGSVYDPALLGFADDELAALFRPAVIQGLTEPDAVPEALPDPVSRLEDVWTCGPHRVVCGDARHKVALEAALAGRLADCLWTDPPYNVAYEGAAGSIKNDALSASAFEALLQAAFMAASTVMKPGAPAYVFHADTEGLAFRRAFRFAGFVLSGCLIWAKDSLVLGRSDYQWQHEPCLYGWKPGAKHRWFGGRKNVTLQELPAPPFTLQEDGTLVIRLEGGAVTVRGKDLVVEPVEGTVLRHPKPARSAEHPTMKPTELVARCLRNSTEPGDLVLDSFGGSGSTLIACEQLGRICGSLDLEPRFVDVQVRRWEAFTGKEARLSDGRTFHQVASEGRK